MLSYIVT
jgi:hypothetical protein